MNDLGLFRQIKTFIFDVDGVLTNSELIVTEEGSLLRKMNTRDGYAIKKALNADFEVTIITGGKSKGVVSRLKALGVENVFYGVQDKLTLFDMYLKENDLDTEEILYMGDDLPDYQVMAKVALPTCPSDAAPEILQLAKYISPKEGGKGCVRDVIERVLKVNDLWTY